ncbi:MAG: glycerol kinase GlpK [Clostridia bacterium]|nr:glycerol kinase GlpK [Clostridia bacterium]
MANQYVLALDQGTTSSRAIVFDKHGNIIAKAQREFEQHYPQAGWVEHNPMDILYSEIQSISAILTEGVVSPDDIVCLGVTNQRETTILWDKTTGLPIYNAPVWQCRRSAAISEDLKARGLEKYIREHTGLLIDAYFSATKIKWLLDNVEGAVELAEAGNLLFGTVETWLIWNLTGGASHPETAVHITDYSNASRTMIFDVDKLEWDEYLCKEIGIPMNILPKPVPSSMIYGYVSPDIPGLESLAGKPISGAIGDQPSALFGQGCFKKGMAKSTYGTGCFMLMNSGTERVHSKNQLTTGVAWSINGETTYAIEGSAFNAGCTIQWLRDELKLIDSAPRCDELAESVEDTNGVYLVPAFTGLGAPYWDMYARGCIVGLTRGANRAHFARATLEALCYQVVDLIKAMEDDSGIDIASLRVDGGASVSDIMMQIQADFLNCEVNRPKVVETTALGAAYLAGLACGVWKDTDEIEINRQVSKIFKPDMDDAKREEMYKGWKKAVSRAMSWVDPE